MCRCGAIAAERRTKMRIPKLVPGARTVAAAGVAALAALMVAGSAGLVAPSVASATTIQPYGCHNSWVPAQFSDGAWDRAITLPNGTVVGYTKNARSTSCANTWFEHFALTNIAYTVDVSVWHPGEAAADTWSGPWANSWQDTPAIDSRRSVQNCAGAQIYYRNGGWIKWQFFGCWTG
jgi:hypothetical protein